MGRNRRREGLGGAEPAAALSLAEVETFVRRSLSPARLAHVEGVVRTAKRLARRLGADGDKAVLAAWLHDVAKEWDREQSLKRARQFGIIFSDLELRVPALWHARLGAAVAKHRFGIADDDVLNAIRYHTTGRAGMSSVERIVFLADIIEPGRTFPGVERLRALSEVDFSAALVAALDDTVRLVVDRGQLLHPDAVAARNDLLLEIAERR